MKPMEIKVVIERQLKEELAHMGQRYTSEYKSLSDRDKMELIAKLKGRRIAAEERDKSSQLKSKSTESDVKPPGTSPLEGGAGGGRRVIRSSRGMS